ncbi:uncharacterized protein B0P05DRAFT_577734 [Gilbertella persicaria]|uniref:uncharacterized protein n=1 Tax=Gilbertella persicaria TaxID=101096 RepID=UPI00221F2F50|nr:uncharacterized protein B0P05DRAFT_577734 [Gilbertella persicaria]KAI8090258.1 hypothetical protein B0P05DRAFT_577734 [Gilbertella persicaria]
MLLATAVAIVCTSNVLAQTTTAAETYDIPNAKIAWKNKYPSGTTKPVPKPEWVALVKDDAALKITPNILTPDGIIKNANPTGNNTHCNWTWDGCVKPTDIVHCTDPKVWGTSFDDGPYEITRELLSYLKSIDRKVTFFVVGKQVITWPEILKEAYDQGHEIGVHTWTHSELTTIPNEQIIAEIKWTELAIKEVLGVTPRLMRPPRGDIDDRVRYIVKQLGYTPAMWSVDSQDWRITTGGQTEAGLLADVTAWANKLPTMTTGGNSLMHDLNNVTVGAALKALPILHPKVQLSTVGTCAGWAPGASYVETNGKTNTNATAPASTSSVAPASKNAAATSDAQTFSRPALYTTALVSVAALISSVL